MQFEFALAPSPRHPRAMTLTRGEFDLRTEATDMQPERIHAYLSRSYWAEGVPLDIIRRSIAHSLCFGLFTQGLQIGFCRVVTDQSTFAYLCDVYVLEEFRGQGLARWMLEAVLADPRLQGLRRFFLATRDAHRLYAGLGFKAPDHPESFMEIRRSGLYKIGGLPDSQS